MEKLENLTIDEYIHLTLNGMLWKNYPEATGDPIKDIKDTSIKKYIPINYELDTTKVHYVDLDVDGTGLLTFYLKKKKKTFKDYILHFYEVNSEIFNLPIEIYNHENDGLKGYFNNHFVKYGILKLICDDHNLTISELYDGWLDKEPNDNVTVILNMLPENFMKDLFM